MTMAGDDIGTGYAGIRVCGYTGMRVYRYIVYMVYIVVQQTRQVTTTTRKPIRPKTHTHTKILYCTQ